MAKQIVNGVEYSNEFDPQIYAKIGTSPLETQADNLSDAVNEIKQSLSDLDFEDITSSLTFSGYYIASHTNFKCFKSKSIMYINVALQLQNNPPASTPIITGFPTNIAINPSLGAMSGGKVVRINSSGQLTNDDALSSGWLTGSFVVLLTN